MGLLCPIKTDLRLVRHFKRSLLNFGYKQGVPVWRQDHMIVYIQRSCYAECSRTFCCCHNLQSLTTLASRHCQNPKTKIVPFDKIVIVWRNNQNGTSCLIENSSLLFSVNFTLLILPY